MSSSQLPSTMRAWTYRSRGKPREVLSLTDNHPVPALQKDTDVLVKVSHAGLNPLGNVLMKLIPSIRGRAWIPEGDLSGRVVKAGASVPSSLAEEGTLVAGTVDMNRLLFNGIGSLAEYVIAPAETLVPISKGISLAEAAGFGAVGCTVVEMMEKAGVKDGSRVLINGASGGTGTFAVQIAKAIGAYVVATCSERNAEMVKGLGADEIVDYRANAPVHSYFGKHYSSPKFDIILDCVGTAALFRNCPSYLIPDGIFINIGNFEGIVSGLINNFCFLFQPRFLGGVPRKYIFFSANFTQKRLKRCLELIEQGRLRVPIDEVYEMDDALSAYDRLMSKRASGKVIVKVQNV